MPERRFPNPWSAEDNGSCFIVKDKNGQALAYVYYEEEPGRRSAARLLTRDEARRIAVNIAKLPQQFREDRVMSEEISFLDAAGKPVSGRFVVRDGMVTATAPDGRTRTAGIEDSMLCPETLAKTLLLQLHQEPTD